MKVRQGFVSNSSSSSFIAVGFSKYVGWNEPDDPTFKELYDLLSIGEYGEVTGPGEVLGCGYGKYVLESGISVYCSEEGPFFIGLDMMKFINDDKTLSEAKAEVKKLVESLGVKCDRDPVVVLDTCGW